MTGRLGSWAIYANLPQAIYVCDKTEATVVVVNICNRNNVPALIRIAVSASSTSPANADYIEYDVELGPKGVLERTGVTVSPGQYIVVQSSVDAVSAVCWGPTIGDEYPVTPISTAPKWSTDTNLTVYAGSTAAVQLKAVDPKGASEISYSLGSGSTLPLNTTLTSTGLITGLVSTADYNTSGVTTTAIVNASDGTAITPRTFNITRRWQDGLSSANAAPSAEYINTLTGTTTDAAYWIDLGDGPFQVYCLMSQGGYMLAGKIPARGAFGQPWNYDGSRWSSLTSVNESECANTNAGDALSRVWWKYTSTTGFIMSLNAVSNRLTVARPGLTCLANFHSAGQYNITSLSRANFMTWIATAGTASSNWDNQPNSNRIGFNRIDISTSKMRFGITMNNEADDNSNDSAIGFGTYTNNDTTGLRNVEAGGHSWNPDRRYSYQGFIFVR